MGFLKNLKEQLTAQQIYDSGHGKYETRFKVEGETYAFIAETVAGDCADDYEWMLTFENIQLHRITMGDNDMKVINAFTEAVDQWVKNYGPYCFTIGGCPCEVSAKIIEGIKKKVKKYNVIDETVDVKDESTGTIIPGNPVGTVRFTKMVTEEETTAEEKSDTKQTKLEDTYEEPKDIKPNKKFMSYKKDEKLDDGKKSYDTKFESFAQFKERKIQEKTEDKTVQQYVQKFKDKMKGYSLKTAIAWVDGIKGISEEQKDEIKKSIGITK